MSRLENKIAFHERQIAMYERAAEFTRVSCRNEHGARIAERMAEGRRQQVAVLKAQLLSCDRREVVVESTQN